MSVWLPHLQDKAKYTKFSRTCWSFRHRKNQESKMAYAFFGGSNHKTVSAAHTSQICTDPLRGYLSKDNHKGGYASPCRSTSKDFNRGR